MWNQSYLDRIKSDHTYYLFDPNDRRDDSDEVYIRYPDSTEIIFDVAIVHMLSPQENTGQHNIFFDILDENYNPTRGHVILCENTGNLRQEVLLDKRMDEPGGNTPLFWNDTYCVSVRGDVASARICNLHARLKDIGEGSTAGHHSYYVMFVRRKRQGEVKPPVDPPTDTVQFSKNVFSEIQLSVTYLENFNREVNDQLERLRELLGKHG